MVQRDLLINYIQGLSVGSTGSFITPVFAKRIIDFVHLLRTRAPVTDAVRYLKKNILLSSAFRYRMQMY
jgi:hypothetical protein